MSETSAARRFLLPFCKGIGLDIGFGGDPIKPEAICLDREEGAPGRAKESCPQPTHLVGDAACLRWFADGQLDYVFSSHCLEDFEDTVGVLKEWLRVIRPGGNLVLYLPDEQRYRKSCEAAGASGNAAHIHSHFSSSYVRECLAGLGQIGIIYCADPCPVGSYSFALVLRKNDNASP